MIFWHWNYHKIGLQILQGDVETIFGCPCEVETFTLLCGEFTQNTVCQVLSETAKFYRRYDKGTFWLTLCLGLGHGVYNLNTVPAFSLSDGMH